MARTRDGATADPPGAPEAPLNPADPAQVTAGAPIADGAPQPATVVEAGTPFLDAASAAIVAEQPIPLPQPGPGAGALQVAERGEATRLRPLDPAAGDPAQRVPRAEAYDPRFDPRTGLPSAGGGRRVLGVIDAARVPGRRLATAARTVEHDNAIYEAGQYVPLSFAQYTDLVAIGAVMADPWDALEDAAALGL